MNRRGRLLLASLTLALLTLVGACESTGDTTTYVGVGVGYGYPGPWGPWGGHGWGPAGGSMGGGTVIIGGAPMPVAY
jgi:hypothetical protein